METRGGPGRQVARAAGPASACAGYPPDRGRRPPWRGFGSSTISSRRRSHARPGGGPSADRDGPIAPSRRSGRPPREGHPTPPSPRLTRARQVPVMWATSGSRTAGSAVVRSLRGGSCRCPRVEPPHNGNAVDEGSVGRVAVGNVPGAAVLEHDRVLAAHRGLVDGEVGGREPAGREPVVAGQVQRDSGRVHRAQGRRARGQARSSAIGITGRTRKPHRPVPTSASSRASARARRRCAPAGSAAFIW